MKKTQVYKIIFLTSLLGSQIYASQAMIRTLQVMRAVAGDNHQLPTTLTRSSLGALDYSALQTALSAASLPLTQTTAQGALTTEDNVSFAFSCPLGAGTGCLGFAFPTTTWPNTAVSNLYTLLNAISSFNLATGVTYLMLAFDAQGNLIKTLVNANVSSLNFYLFAYDYQGKSLFPSGIAVPIATMGNNFSNVTALTSQMVSVDLNGQSATPGAANYPVSLVVTSPTQATAIANAQRGIPGKGSLVKPVPSSQTIPLNPSTDPKTLPGVVHTVAIPSSITAMSVWPNTNVGDLYTAINLSAANIALVNAALAKGTSLQVALDVQQNNANYNVTITIYDLQSNVIAQQVTQNVTNSASSGVSNTANIAPGAVITTPTVFSWYTLDVQVQGQNTPISMSGMTLSSTVILAASAKSVAMTSPIQSLVINSASSIAGLALDVNVSVQNILDINTALAAGQSVSMLTNVTANSDGNYDLMFKAYDQQGNLVAQEARKSVVNSSSASNTANIAQNAVIPVSAGTFSGTNITCTLMNTQETLNFTNVPFTNTLTLAPNIPASSVVALPTGVTGFTDINVIVQFGSTSAPGVMFDQADLDEINTALAAGHTVVVQCNIQNSEVLLGALDFTANKLLVENFALPTGVTAASFSGYQLQYLRTGQVVGSAVPAAQTLQCAAGQTITFIPAMTPIAVTSAIVPGTAGATSFSANAASLKAITASTYQAYNQETPVSVVGGLSALTLISVQLTDANTTAYLKFDFTPTAGLQNVTQELLDNGLYVCFNIVANTPASGQYSAVVTLEDAQGNVYASGSAQIMTQMVYGWVGFNVDSSATALTATSTSVKAIPLAAQQAVLYRQQTVTSPAQ